MDTQIEIDDDPLSIYPSSPIDLRSFAKRLEESIYQKLGHGAIVSSVHRSSEGIDRQVIYQFAIRLEESTVISMALLNELTLETVVAPDNTHIYPIRRVTIGGSKQLKAFVELMDLSNDRTNGCCILAFEIHTKDCHKQTHSAFIQKMIEHDASPLKLPTYHYRYTRVTETTNEPDELNAILRIITSGWFFSTPCKVCHITQGFEHNRYTFTFTGINDVIEYQDLQMFKLSCRVKFLNPKDEMLVNDCCMAELLFVQVMDGDVVVRMEMPSISSIKITRNVKIPSTNGVTNYDNTQKFGAKSVNVQSPARRSNVLRTIRNKRNAKTLLKPDSLREYAVNMISTNNDVKVFV